ncbi:MAG: hypothetical protein ABI977_04500 [Acidobacteriota bacterium]
MGIEILKTLNEGISIGLLTMIEAIALITVFFAIAGLVISFVSIAWLCFEETRQPAPCRMKPARRYAMKRQLAVRNVLDEGKPCGMDIVSAADTFPKNLPATGSSHRFFHMSR